LVEHQSIKLGAVGSSPALGAKLGEITGRDFCHAFGIIQSITTFGTDLGQLVLRLRDHCGADLSVADLFISPSRRE
jgi:hypothetical protein